ncbi:hypothetical protein ABUE31_17410 [Mesorhizobium sp. ZMM04-5]|uniref:Glucosamine inositolphosphorylceramide transferase 1 N-terminal domain-containing protein n=1 Tax=Mesorhizobium marinum TaxID=3228790 RepID=A0ABV3R3V0_9HYPH
MSVAPPASSRDRILVVVGDAALARWVVSLVEALRRSGAAAFLRIARSEGPRPSSALATLLGLEKMLVAGHRPGGADRIGPDELDKGLIEPADFRPDIVIDLDEGGERLPRATRLRPLYDGEPGETALASSLFFRGTPRIAIERTAPDDDGGRIVAEGTASLEAASGIGGGIDAVASRVATLLLKALAGTGDGAPGAPAIPVRPIGSRDIAMRAAKDVARAAVRAAYRLCCHGSHWRVGWRFATPGDDVWTRRDLAGGRWNVLADPVDHFYADPFPLHWQGRDYLFFEDLDHKTGKGIISVVAFDEAGRPGPAVAALEEPWHLSYPFLIERGGEIFMIPESSANRDIALYRATGFPAQWRRHTVLVEGVEAADATIVEHDGLLYMFAVVRDGVGGYSDTLAIWWAEDLFGPWRPHAGNPVLVDDRAARPAGNFVRRGGALYRPVQDCRRAYGGALGFMKVTRLDREGFAQAGEGTISGGGAWPGKRLHTLNYNGRLEAIDGFTLRPRFKPAADLVDRWYRPGS